VGGVKAEEVKGTDVRGREANFKNGAGERKRI